MSNLETRLKKNEPLKLSLGKIKAFSKQVLKDQKDEFLTDHGFDHCERIATRLLELDTVLPTKLNQSEVFLLLASCYLHDTGVQLPMHGDTALDHAEHEKQSVRIIFRGTELKPDFPHLDISAEWLALITPLVLSHRSGKLLPSVPSAVRIYDSDVRLDLLATMLCLADELDLDKRRADVSREGLGKAPPIESRLEWWKHQYIIGVKVQPALPVSEVLLTYMFTSAEDLEFEEALQMYIQDKLHRTIHNCGEVFRKHRLLLELANPIVLRDGTVRIMPKDVREALLKKTMWPLFLADNIINACANQTRREIRERVGGKHLSGPYVLRAAEGAFEQFLSGEKRYFILIGKAGTGKTSLMCRLALQHLGQNPTIFLSCVPTHGITVEDGARKLKSEIERRLEDEFKGYPALLQALGPRLLEKVALAARAQGSNVLLFIDGAGIETDWMLNTIHTLVSSIGGNHVPFKVCISSREVTWGYAASTAKNEPLPFVHPASASETGTGGYGHIISDFSDDEFEMACDYYFPYYDIKLRVDPTSQKRVVLEARDRLKHPLLLRLYCEGSRGYKNGPLPEVRIVELFDSYTEVKTKCVSKSLSIDDKRVEEVFTMLADAMLNNYDFSLEPNHVWKMLESKGMQEAKKAYDTLLEEGVLIEECFPFKMPPSRVSFMFEEFHEYLKARDLISHARSIEGDQAGREGVIQSFQDTINALKHYKGRFGVAEFFVLLAEGEWGDVHVHLLDLLAKDRHHRLRQIVPRAIRKLKAGDLSPQLTQYLTKLSRDQDPSVLIELAEACGELFRKCPQVSIDLLNKLVRSADVRVVGAACRAATKAGSEHKPWLFNLFTTVSEVPGPRVVNEMLVAVRSLSFSDLSFVASLLRRLAERGIPGINLNLIGALQATASRIGAESIQILLTVAKSRATSAEQGNAARAIIDLVDRFPNEVSEACHELMVAHDPGARTVLASSAERLGRRLGKEFALILLLKLSADPDLGVRIATWNSAVALGYFKADDGEHWRTFMRGERVEMAWEDVAEPVRYDRIVKRNGSEEVFDREKIANGIFGAAQREKGEDRAMAQHIAKLVVLYLFCKQGLRVPKYQEVGDAVEKVLIETGHARTAKSFILYRNKKRKKSP